MPQNKEDKNKLKEISQDLNDILLNPETIEVQKLKTSNIYSLYKKILNAPNLAEDEDLNYYNTVLEIIKSFEKTIPETYLSLDKIKKEPEQSSLFGKNFSKEDTVIITLVSINLAQKFKEIIDANNVLVLMSGTLHSEQVLKDIFGIENFKTIEAEAKSPGKIIKQRTGLERNCSYANFSNETITRDMYLKIFDVCMANSNPPTLVHVSAFKDLPTEEENARLKFDNLITQEKIKELQSYGNQEVERFSNKQKTVLFSTKCARGVDFAGDTCNSIVITRYPYPNISGLFWKILKKEQPDKFMEFYLDKARRDLIQKVARGVRFKGDKVELWSPDIRVINQHFN